MTDEYPWDFVHDVPAKYDHFDRPRWWHRKPRLLEPRAVLGIGSLVDIEMGTGKIGPWRVKSFEVAYGEVSTAVVKLQRVRSQSPQVER
jgi:hypothetical protein